MKISKQLFGMCIALFDYIVMFQNIIFLIDDFLYSKIPRNLVNKTVLYVYCSKQWAIQMQFNTRYMNENI